MDKKSNEPIFKESNINLIKKTDSEIKNNNINNKIEEKENNSVNINKNIKTILFDNSDESNSSFYDSENDKNKNNMDEK